MARRPVPGSRLTPADIDDLEADHGVEIPYRRSSVPPKPKVERTLEQIADEAARPRPYAECQRYGGF